MSAWINKNDCDITPLRKNLDVFVENYFENEPDIYKEMARAMGEELLRTAEAVINTAREKQFESFKQWENASIAPAKFFHCHQCSHNFLTKNYSISDKNWFYTKCPFCHNNCIASNLIED